MILNFLHKITTQTNADSYLFFIAGQSNAVGWSTGQPLDVNLRNPISNAYIWNGSEWETLQYGVNNEGQNGHGIELKLGYYITNSLGKKCYIIKYASGSSALGDETSNSNDWSLSGGTLRSSLITKANNALQNLITNSISYEIKGFYWDQGERDANYDYLAINYKTNLEDFFSYLRANITGLSITNKFVATRLSSHITRTYLSTVRTAVETASISNYDYIDQDDLTLQSDHIHYTSNSQNTKADRFISKIFT